MKHLKSQYKLFYPILTLVLSILFWVLLKFVVWYESYLFILLIQKFFDKKFKASFYWFASWKIKLLFQLLYIASLIEVLAKFGNFFLRPVLIEVITGWRLIKDEWPVLVWVIASKELTRDIWSILVKSLLLVDWSQIEKFKLYVQVLYLMAEYKLQMWVLCLMAVYICQMLVLCLINLI